MGGIRLNEPAVDLAICAALAGGYRNEPIDKYTAVFGEVGLTGEVRGVTFAEKRVNECIKWDSNVSFSLPKTLKA